VPRSVTRIPVDCATDAPADIFTLISDAIAWVVTVRRSRQSTKIHAQDQGLQLLFCRAPLPLSSRTLNYAAGIIRRHRKAIGSCWRKLNPGHQALLVLAYLRKGETFAQLASGFEVGTTAWRYVNETTKLLAAPGAEVAHRSPATRKRSREDPVHREEQDGKGSVSGRTAPPENPRLQYERANI
jgi:Helix-turn-helix of DDE superfamily endonuclease